MYTYKFIVEAERERFMEPPLRETSERYIAADSYDQAHSYVPVVLYYYLLQAFMFCTAFSKNVLN